MKQSLFKVSPKSSLFPGWKTPTPSACQVTSLVSTTEIFPFTTFYTSETQFSSTIQYQQLTKRDTSLIPWNANTKQKTSMQNKWWAGERAIYYPEELCIAQPIAVFFLCLTSFHSIVSLTSFFKECDLLFHISQKKLM